MKIILALFVLMFLTASAQAKNECTYTLNPTSGVYTTFGGSGSFNVITQEGCAWTASTTDSWISLGVTSGTGSGQVTFTHLAKTGFLGRSGSIRINNNLLFSVIQSANPCPVTIDPVVLDIPASGGNATLNVTSCGFTVESVPGFVTVASRTQNSVTFNFAPNSGSARTGFIILNYTVLPGTFNSRPVPVSQASGCAIVFNRTAQNLTGASQTAEFWVLNSVPGCPPVNWTATTNTPWINLTASAGASPSPVVFTVTHNPALPRTGTINVTVGGTVHSLTVNQEAGCSYSLSAPSTSISASGGNGAFTVNTQTGCVWSAQSSVSWIALTAGNGTGSGNVEFTIQQNTGQQRSGIISVNGQVYTVNQTAAPVTPQTITATAVVVSNNGKNIRNAIVTFTANGESQTVLSNHAGYVRFKAVIGQNYSVTIKHKKYTFNNRTVNYQDGNFTFVFTANP